jgi:hypothetical protein
LSYIKGGRVAVQDLVEAAVSRDCVKDARRTLGPPEFRKGGGLTGRAVQLVGGLG